MTDARLVDCRMRLATQNFRRHDVFDACLGGVALFCQNPLQKVSLGDDADHRCPRPSPSATRPSGGSSKWPLPRRWPVARSMRPKGPCSTGFRELYTSTAPPLRTRQRYNHHFRGRHHFRAGTRSEPGRIASVDIAIVGKSKRNFATSARYAANLRSSERPAPAKPRSLPRSRGFWEASISNWMP